MSKNVVTEWLQSSPRRDLLTPTQIIELSRVIQNPNTTESTKKKAVDTIVNHNLKIVVKLTVEFLGRRGIKSDNDIAADYLQQGVFGLIRAAEKFDPTKGYTFSTYSYRWVRKHLTDYYYKNFSLVHIPQNTLIAFLGGHSRNCKVEFIEAASRVASVDSLDRLVIDPHTGNAVRFGDIVAQELVY
jgi:RNA polymerase sigma factor (sigma-70 family)